MQTQQTLSRYERILADAIDAVNDSQLADLDTQAARHELAQKVEDTTHSALTALMAINGRYHARLGMEPVNILHSGDDSPYARGYLWTPASPSKEMS